MKNTILKIVTDLQFLLFLGIIFSNLLGQWLGYPIWWTAKYGMLLFAYATGFNVIKKGNSVLLTTLIIGSILAVAYPLFPNTKTERKYTMIAPC